VPARMAKWRADAADRLKSNERPINVGRLIDELNAVMPGDAILVADGGFAGHWGGLLFDTRKPAAISSPIAGSPRSATACPAAWARRSPPDRAAWSGSPATAAST
jgi:thiamine pyrophosphate-dependent acetolactate synthase large subunit-like protein